MKIKDYIEVYQEFTGLASNIARQLMFAGIALIWIFKVTQKDIHTLPLELFFPVTLLIFALIVDLMQYVVASVIWYSFYRYHESKRVNMNDDPNIEAPAYFTYILNIFFISKLILVLVAYYKLLFYSYTKIVFL